MATRFSQAIGSRIKSAREAAGWTQEQLGRDVGLERSAIAKIESGSRNVSAIELASLAEALDVRMEWFVEDGPPAVVSFRNRHEPGAASPQIDKLTERLAREVEFIARLDADHAMWDSLPEPFECPTNEVEVERTATEARALLGLDTSAPAVGLSGLVGRIGLLAFSWDLGPDAADGSSILLSAGGVAVVNGASQVGRRRLTLAHELGHYLFADDFSIDWHDQFSSDSGSREARIDHFARAVLLPRNGVRTEWGRLRSGHDLRESAIIIASRFRVDMSTLARRLAELDLIDGREASAIRRFRTERADIVEHDLLIHDELAPPELARPYVAAVLRAFRNEDVSEARAMELLLDTWVEADLPERPTLRENAIWSFVS